jgi:ABC-2 type transport system permease protein
MPIFDQGYQHWDGKLSGHAWRWLAIANRGVRTQLKNRWTRMALLGAWLPALVLGVFLACWGLLEQKTEEWRGFFAFLPAPVLLNPKDFRAEIWSLAFYLFLQVETFGAMILVLIVGPNLISQDLRFNAIPLYLSRPLTRFDYFAGKLATIAAFVAAVIIVPALLTYAIGIAFSLSFRVVVDTYHIVPACLGYGVVVVLVTGMFMLAISSLSKNSRYVAATWIGLWLVGGFAAGVLSEKNTLNYKWGPIVSLSNDLTRIREAFLGAGAAYAKIQTASQEMLANVERPRLGSLLFGRRPRRQRRIETPEGVNPFEQTYPWQWSAYVLGGLVVLSTCILTTRVKSLDRLR